MNRDMQYDEIKATLEFLMRNEPKIRRALVEEKILEEEPEKYMPKEYMPAEEPEKYMPKEYMPAEEPEKYRPKEYMPAEEPEKKAETGKARTEPIEVHIDKLNNLKNSLNEIRREINIIKIVTKQTIARYEIKLVKSGEYEGTVLR